ncbi:MAG: SDR family NAD(P)-dependent oxidoreductase [Celeribacter sp.]|jgi:NAD(P)-dependent dehydrogenase (short-subunit alcohol dehydrogenase family)
MAKTLVIGASGGIGAALCTALRDAGQQVTALSRRDTGIDLTDEASIRDALASLEPPYSQIIVATGALVIDGAEPEKTLRDLDPTALAAQYQLNAIGPALVLKHALRLLPRDERTVFAALSARVGSIGDNRLGGWYGYRAAKAGLNALIHGGAIEVARSHPQAICVCLHPGTVATEFTRAYAGRHPTVPPAEAAANLLRVMEGLTPADSGGFHDWAGATVPW